MVKLKLRRVVLNEVYWVWHGELRLARCVWVPCTRGDKCRGTNWSYDDSYGCDGCEGAGRRFTSQEFTAGHFFRAVGRAAELERAFQEGHSAGLTDALV